MERGVVSIDIVDTVLIRNSTVDFAALRAKRKFYYLDRWCFFAIVRCDFPSLLALLQVENIGILIIFIVYFWATTLMIFSSKSSFHR
jgi:hypothetical protein